MSYEFFISIQNSEGSVRVLFSMSFEPSPNFGGNEEIISFNFSSERERRNTEITLSVIEVIMIFRIFV